MPEATAWRSIQLKSGSGSSQSTGVANKRTQSKAMTQRHRRTNLKDGASGISARRSRGLGYDLVPQHADSADLDLHVVAILHPQRRRASGADAARGARHD